MQTYAMNREINMDNEYDLVVAGGGPGGTAAAICAARLGAKVLLLEATI
jgi:flavin-dependent dehydrogenase